MENCTDVQFFSKYLNLRAFNEDTKSVIDLTETYFRYNILKNKIMELYYVKEFLNACFYFNFRDYQSVDIKSNCSDVKKLIFKFETIEN